MIFVLFCTFYYILSTAATTITTTSTSSNARPSSTSSASLSMNSPTPPESKSTETFDLQSIYYDYIEKSTINSIGMNDQKLIDKWNALEYENRNYWNYDCNNYCFRNLSASIQRRNYWQCRNECKRSFDSIWKSKWSNKKLESIPRMEIKSQAKLVIFTIQYNASTTRSSTTLKRDINKDEDEYRTKWNLICHQNCYYRQSLGKGTSPTPSLVTILSFIFIMDLDELSQCISQIKDQKILITIRFVKKDFKGNGKHYGKNNPHYLLLN